MDRRQILAGTAASLATLAVARRAFAADFVFVKPDPRAATLVPPVSPAAHALYERALVFDANANPPFEEKPPLTPADIAVVKTCGVTGVKTSLGGINASFEDTVGEIAFAQYLIEAYPDLFTQIRVVGDFARAKAEKKLGILLSFESADMFEGKLDRIELFRGLGVRVMQLSYNKHTAWASGVMEDPPTGLTAEGKNAVAKMNEVGVAIDISHASVPSYMDTIAASTKPVLVTHTGCAAVHKHPRNKSDEQLRAVAQKGGVVGIFDLPYLTKSPKQPALDDYMAHMIHALKICGEDHVGVGSDSSLSPWDLSEAGYADFQKMEQQRHAAGLAAPEEDRPMFVIGMNHPRRMETIADALLKHGYSESVAEKVLGKNFIAALGTIWG